MKGKLERIHPVLMDVLNALEGYMGFELTITSGHRSVEHNADPSVGGVAGSEHTYDDAEGADVLCLRSATRFKMLQWLFKHSNIVRIGIGKEFIHIGIATDKPQEVAWNYYE